jgi:hypothetical protein
MFCERIQRSKSFFGARFQIAHSNHVRYKGNPGRHTQAAHAPLNTHKPCAHGLVSGPHSLAMLHPGGLVAGKPKSIVLHLFGNLRCAVKKRVYITPEWAL